MKRTHRLMKLLSDELLHKDVLLKRLAHDKVVIIGNVLSDTHHEPFAVSLYDKSCGMPTNEVNEQN